MVRSDSYVEKDQFVMADVFENEENPDVSLTWYPTED